MDKKLCQLKTKYKCKLEFFQGSCFSACFLKSAGLLFFYIFLHSKLNNFGY